MHLSNVRSMALRLSRRPDRLRADGGNAIEAVAARPRAAKTGETANRRAGRGAAAPRSLARSLIWYRFVQYVCACLALIRDALACEGPGSYPRGRGRACSSAIT